MSSFARAPGRAIPAMAIAGLAAFALAGCHGESRSGTGELAPPAGPRVDGPVSTVRPGSEIQVQATGFTQYGNLRVSFGQPAAEQKLVLETGADGEGRLDLRLRVPAWAEPGHPYVVVIAAPGYVPRAVSEPFVVAFGGEPIRVDGRLTGEGTECITMRDHAGTLYTLAGASIELKAGTAVTVQGRVGEASDCAQGTALVVESIQRRGVAESP
jgi:hypothetical protein